MPRYVALLRGINVGRNKRVAMADLRRLLDGLGYTGVRTLLQSGNAVFTTPAGKSEKLARQIEQAIEDELGLDVKCLVRTGEDMRAVVDGNPLGDMATDGAKLLALFLSEAPDATLLAAHDPTQLDRQGPDTGPQYRSALFFTSPAQQQVAERYIAQLDAARVFPAKIVTQRVLLPAFFAAEADHQDYATRNPRSPYIARCDAPKLANLQRLFAAQYRSAPVLVSAQRAG